MLRKLTVGPLFAGHSPDRSAREMVCEHGTAMDVHCCNCHGGFLFDSSQCVCVLEDSEMATDDGSYLWERCYACGHRLRFASD